MDVHPALAPVEWLLGSWAGEGEGTYPSIDDFRYREEVVWSHNGKPMLSYVQRTSAVDDGRPLHGECGYLRVTPDGLELVVAHGTGLVEIATGAVTETIELHSVAVTGTPTAKEVTSVARTLRLDADAMHVTLEMAAVGIPLQVHLRAVLQRA